MLHQFSPAEPKGQRTCPKCEAGITGATTIGKCSDLQQRDTSTPGNNPNCDHVFTKKMTKDKKKIKELEAQLAACGGASAAPSQSLMAENARLITENARLVAENARLSSLPSFSDGEDNDDIFGMGSLTRSHSLTRIPSLTTGPSGNRRDDSLSTAVSGSPDIEDILGLLDEPVPTTSSEADLRQENVRLKAELDTVRSTLQGLLQRMS